MIGKAIEHFRELNNMTKSDLAEKTGLSSSSITQYEKGNRNPSNANLELISKALNVSLNKLKETAENIELSMEKEPSIDENELRRRLAFIYGNNDAVVELTKHIVVGIRLRAHDLVYEQMNRQQRLGIPRDRKPAIIEVMTEKVLRDFINQNLDEVADRLTEEIHHANYTVEEMIQNLRERYY